jgi:D-alanyl-lipoteichoic acid acyltransferase DltB (MBOAT superfamily)
MLPQFRRARRFPNSERLYTAGVLIVTGLFKKVVLADSMAPIVNRTFAAPEGKGALPLALGIIAFSIQIYGDFAGYTDIARGVARLFGIDIPRNFEQPYLSRNITQFWRTWHISLSSFLHDYLYVPLGGNRGTPGRTYRNLIVTMLLGGLWHGAAWGFVFWGGMHGLALAIHRAMGGGNESRDRSTLRVPSSDDLLAVAGTFILVSCLWVFFRADSIADAFSYFGGMTEGLIGPRAGSWKVDLPVVVLMATTMFVIDIVDRRRRVANPLKVSPMFIQGALAAAAVLAVIVWSGQEPTPFIYFQF